MTTPVTLDHVLRLTEQLSPLDKVRLIEYVAPQLERDRQLLTPRRSLRGLWRGLAIAADDITAARHEAWANFPRRDLP